MKQQMKFQMNLKNILFQKGVNIYKNPLPSSFIEAVNNGDKAVQAYFANLSKGSKPLREAKLMILAKQENLISEIILWEKILILSNQLRLAYI